MPNSALEVLHKHFAALIDYKCEKAQLLKKHPYGHPFLRTAVDTLTAIALTLLMNGFLDIGDRKSVV